MCIYTNKTGEEFIAYRALMKIEVDNNYEIFREKYLDKFIVDHPEEYALMKDGEFVGFFADIKDAVREGEKRYEDKVFSTHRISKDVVNLGSFSSF